MFDLGSPTLCGVSRFRGLRNVFVFFVYVSVNVYVAVLSSACPAVVLICPRDICGTWWDAAGVETLASLAVPFLGSDLGRGTVTVFLKTWTERATGVELQPLGGNSSV